METPGTPKRIPAAGLCAAEMARASALLGGQPVAVGPADLPEPLAALAREKHRLESALECMSEGLLILDPDYRGATVNPAARALLGVNGLEELAGKLRAGEIDPGLHPVFWLDAHDEHAKPLRCWAARQCEQRDCPAYGSGLFPCWLYDGTLCEGGTLGRFPAKLEACSRCPVYQGNARLEDPAQAYGRREVSIARPARKTLVSLSAPIVDEAGRFLGVVKLLRDVTTERMLEQLRADFTSFITHELRTPLTSVSGFLALVLGGYAGEVTEAQRRQLEAAHRQAKRLEGLVDNLLDLSAIEVGRLELQIGHFDLVPLLVEAAEVLRPQAVAKGVELRVGAVDEPLLVAADRERVLQVLTNLLANAVKYTDEGGRVNAAARPTADGVAVEVADTGRGIPAEEIPHIFDKFYRVRAGARRVHGSGLGLAICRGIVEAHGGRIWAESAPGQGSRFHFTIPPAPEVGLG